MSTLMESPVWILLTGLGVVSVLVVCFLQTGQRAFGIAAISSLAVFSLVLLWERSIKTDRELLRDTVDRMANAVEDNDVDTLATFVSPDAPHCLAAVRFEMPTYTFERCQVIKYFALEFDRPSEPRKAKAVIYVWADLDAPRYSYRGHVRRRVILFFEKYNDKRWLLVDYAHEDPSGPSPYLSPDRRETFQADL